MSVTLLTGTSTGIGYATALHFARRGHPVVATVRNLAKAAPLETAARAGYSPRDARRTRSLSSRLRLEPSATMRPVWST